MSIKNKIIILMAILVIIITETRCKKYLSLKPDKALAIPGTLQDLQALLDYYSRVNNVDPASAVQSVDDFYLTATDYDALRRDGDKRMYIWKNENLFETYPNDWSYQYDIINIANTVLDNIDNIQRTTDNANDWDNLKGQALLFRARSFQLVAWLWANAYDKNTAATELGIPLRLRSDFNIPTVRASLQETYERIIKDLKDAVPLLPLTPVHIMRPSKPAAYALLARTYLSMLDYTNTSNYSDSCLRLFSKLIDFNSLNPSANYPIARFNEEIIMENRIPVPSMFTGTKAKIDSLLFQSYEDSDLRKEIFFKNNNGFYTFKGSYEGSTAMFSGIATDEVALMKAECLARAGNTSDAMDELNSLLIKRFKNSSFIPLVASNSEEALSIILQERRKELLMRGLRWMDIKRLNKEGANIKMSRILEGKIYTLSPNDKGYALAIPQDVVILSGIQQNPK